MKDSNKIRWFIYGGLALVGICLILPWHCYHKEIMLNLGTGLIASCITACLVEMVNAIGIKKKNKQNFLMSNNDIRSEIISMLNVYNRILNSIAFVKKEKKTFENKTFNELLSYYITESNIIKSYTAPYIANNGIATAEELEQQRTSREINKVIREADEKLKNIKIKIGKIAENFTVAKTVQLTSGICSDEDVKCMNGLFSIFSLETSQIAYEAEFYQFAHCFSEIQNCIPEFYKRLGLDTILFSNKTGYLDITSKGKRQKRNNRK